MKGRIHVACWVALAALSIQFPRPEKNKWLGMVGCLFLAAAWIVG